MNRSETFTKLFRWGAVVACLQAGLLTAEEKLDFNKDIRPILSNKCYYCHGPDVENNKGDLRLDIREEAIASEAIVPGNLDDSEMIYRILTDDKEDLMPPPKSHKSLTKKEKELLKRWVKEGAEYDSHWSYKKVERPQAKGIDEIVSKGLKKHGLTHSKRAKRETLARRLYLDVLGLPPTPEQMKNFLDKPDNEASYEELVDELLKSPRYGENMASYWLDAVRYADTIGYHSDSSRDASPFRDYVIHAYNSNKPYDAFITEQLAGDLIPNATMEQRVASGYNRINQISQEGGIQDLEYLKKYQAERVRTTATTMLGSTLACAECHDHKFDPFTAKDFYSFAAFFSDVLEKGAWNGDGSYQEKDFKKYFEGKPELVEYPKYGPTLRVPNRTFLNVTAEHEAELKSRKQLVDKGTDASLEELKKWIQSRSDLKKRGVPETYAFPAADDAQKISVPEELSKLKDTMGFTFEIKEASKKKAERKSFAVKMVFKGGEVVFRWGHDFREKAKDRHIVYKGKGTEVKGDWHKFYLPAKDLRHLRNRKLQSIEFLSSKDKDKQNAYAFRDMKMATTLYEAPKGMLTERGKQLLDKHMAGKETAEEKNELRNLFNHHHAVSQDLEELRFSHKTFDDYLNGSRELPATISAKRRTIRVLPRGNWMDKTGEVVQPATPSFLDFAIKTEDPTKPLTRLDLAKWIGHRDNPLTARTYMNRLWAQFFGAALSSAPEDLGLQGQYPEYPQLLDYLSVEFMESGWDVKRMVKMILMSDTYRQSSLSTPALNEKDPYNRLLARQSPRRLKAENIRDNALSVSGLLVNRMGGRSVMPYQPDGYYQHLNFPRRTYKEDRGENQYRRGIYTHWQRTFLHPMMMAFDAPGRDECAVERPQSNTPLQALNLLNDPTFVEASMSLAKKIVSQQEKDDAKRIDFAYRTVLSRKPNAKELATISAFLGRERERFKKTPAEAEEFLSQFSMNKPDGTATDEWAAWASVSRVILNLHETITRY